MAESQTNPAAVRPDEPEEIDPRPIWIPLLFVIGFSVVFLIVFVFVALFVRW